MASGTAVADIIQRTLETLHSLYEEVGVEEENRTEDASALIAEFEKLCNAKIADIVDLKQETLEQLDREVEAIRFIAAELGIDAPKHATTASLRSQHKQCVTIIAELEQRRAEVAEIISKMHADIHDLKSLLTNSRDSAVMPSFRSFSGGDVENRRYSFVNGEQEDLSDDRIKMLGDELEEVERQAEVRQEKLEEVSNDISVLMQELDVSMANGTPIDLFDETDDFKGALSLDRIAQLERQRACLQEEKSRREDEVRRMSRPIRELWDFLGVPDQEREAFFARNRGHKLSMAVINGCQEELARLEGMRTAQMEEKIATVRGKTEEVLRAIASITMCDGDVGERWRECLGEFAQDFDDSQYSMDLFARHEKQLEVYEALLKDVRALDEKAKEWEKLRAIRDRYEQQRQDKTRLQGRDRAAARAMMEENKMRAKIKCLPKVEKELRSGLRSFRSNHGHPFMYHGEEYGPYVREHMAPVAASSIPRPTATPKASATPMTTPSKAEQTRSARAQSAKPLRTRNGAVRPAPQSARPTRTKPVARG